MPRSDKPAGLLLSALVLGFGTSVAMWATAFVCRLSPSFPSEGLLVLLLAGLLGGAFAAGRLSPGGWRLGALTGLIASVINLLILGSLITDPDAPNAIVPSALWWVPGSFAVGALLGGLGALAGSAGRPAPEAGTRADAAGRLSVVAAAGTLVLLVIGGLVTSKEAGLAVVDWPNSYRYNMFLYPLSRMTGGVYYEHAHRLFGSLVGLTTLVLAGLLLYGESRRWVRRLGVGALLLVIAQGILGGLRVTGKFTMSDSAEDTAPSTKLAVYHGVVGQVFFALMIAMTAFTSRTWRSNAEPRTAAGVGTDRKVGAILVALLILQLFYGALQRHLVNATALTDVTAEALAAFRTRVLLIHITGAVLVTVFALMSGIRAWGLYGDVPALRRTGVLLLVLLGVQIVLGLAALVAAGMTQDLATRPVWDVVLTTAHQAVGALVLGCAVALTLLCFRLLKPEPEVAPLAAEA
jgi:cytochrome c oxidase assembly protein subunit 15